MPNETKQAIEWALTQQTNECGYPITVEMAHELVDKIRDYFNTNNIEYNAFSYDDLIPFLALSE